MLQRCLVCPSTYCLTYNWCKPWLLILLIMSIYGGRTMHVQHMPHISALSNVPCLSNTILCTLRLPHNSDSWKYLFGNNHSKLQTVCSPLYMPRVQVHSLWHQVWSSSVNSVNISEECVNKSIVSCRRFQMTLVTVPFLHSALSQWHCTEEGHSSHSTPWRFCAVVQ